MSFAKILLLVGVIAFVWFGWRWFQRWEKERRLRDAAERRADDPRRIAAEDMVPCRACGTYLPARGAKSCGRADCPQPR